jgi:hypothetical protein
MRILYEASSAVEAHLLKDLLGQEGVPASIHGEFLQGAMGELPAAGLVRLMVADEHYAAGRALIERWEAAAPAVRDDSPDDAVRPAADDRRRPSTRNPRGMWIAVAIVAAACWLYARALEASVGGCMECRVPDADRRLVMSAPEAHAR